VTRKTCDYESTRATDPQNGDRRQHYYFANIIIFSNSFFQICHPDPTMKLLFPAFVLVAVAWTNTGATETEMPTCSPTFTPTSEPTVKPSFQPTLKPTYYTGVSRYYFTGNSLDSVNENHGTVNGGATLTTDRFSQPDSAYMFNGLTGYINVSTGNDFNSKYFTLSFWINPSASNLASGAHVLDKSHYENGADTGGWFFAASGGYYKFGLVTGKNAICAATLSGQTLTANVWTHVAIRKTSNSLTVYKNGAPVVDQYCSDDNILGNGEKPFIIGARNNGGTLDRYFQGKLDDIIYFARALGDGEISDLFSSSKPSLSPTANPTGSPTAKPTVKPTVSPSTCPTVIPTVNPSFRPTAVPSYSMGPSQHPTMRPTVTPTKSPSANPTCRPTMNPTLVPTKPPTANPTCRPSFRPTAIPSYSMSPTARPTANPTYSRKPTWSPTVFPTVNPTAVPSVSPTKTPTATPSARPTFVPSFRPTARPTMMPTQKPTSSPTKLPTAIPTATPTARPTAPTALPTLSPTANPTATPSMSPTAPTPSPTRKPTPIPTRMPTYRYTEGESCSGDASKFQALKIYDFEIVFVKTLDDFGAEEEEYRLKSGGHIRLTDATSGWLVRPNTVTEHVSSCTVDGTLSIHSTDPYGPCDPPEETDNSNGFFPCPIWWAASNEYDAQKDWYFVVPTTKLPSTLWFDLRTYEKDNGDADSGSEISWVDTYQQSSSEVSQLSLNTDKVKYFEKQSSDGRIQRFRYKQRLMCIDRNAFDNTYCD
jgi:hypothetical protein